MGTPHSSMPATCPCCPHFDPFHGTCWHPLRQDVVRSLAAHGGECPFYPDIRAAAMRDLVSRLE